MIPRDEIIAFLDEYMEKDKYRDYLPIGLLVEGAPQVSRVVTAVSACEEIFRRAVEVDAEMVLVHHGMFWEKSDPVVRGSLKKRLRLLLEHDITLVGYHLPLDAHPEVGNNILFARRMGFRNPEPFAEHGGTPIGYKGDFAPIPVAEFQARAREFYGREPMAAFLEGKETVSSAGVVSGGAWDDMEQAAREGVDCFVTGNADEPAFHLAKELGVNFFAFGHYATERVGIRKLGEVVAERCGLDVRFFDVDNPL